MRAGILYTAIMMLFTALIAFSGSGAEAGGRLELTMRQAVEIALRENLSIKDEKRNLDISEADIRVNLGDFDPKLTFGVNEMYSRNPSPSQLTGTEERLITSDAGLEGKINTGTEYDLKWSNRRYKGNSDFLVLNPYYSSDVTLTLTQPLLKGRGKSIQEGMLSVARKTFDISRMRLEDKVQQIIADTAYAYWDILAARDELEVAELSLRLAENLLDEARIRIDAGLLAPVEIYKAEAEAASRQEELIRAKKLISDNEDKLRAILNLDSWNLEIVTLDRPGEPFELQDLDSAIDISLTNRRELQQAYINKQNMAMLRSLAENRLLPDLSIIGSMGLNGLNGSYADMLDSLGSGDYYSWELGLSLSVPLGNRTAKGNLLKAKYDEEKAELNIQSVRQKIITEVREAWRKVKLNAGTMVAATRSRIASEKTLDSEQEKFKVGMTTMNDVLKYQEEYTNALSSEKKARIDYAKAVVALERAKGTLSQDRLSQ